MPGDVIRIMCPRLTCRKVLAVPSSARGRTVRCRSCGATLRIPTQASADAAATAKPIESTKPEQADAA